jgi:hypothetical protein
MVCFFGVGEVVVVCWVAFDAAGCLWVVFFCEGGTAQTTDEMRASNSARPTLEVAKTARVVLRNFGGLAFMCRMLTQVFVSVGVIICAMDVKFDFLPHLVTFIKITWWELESHW